MYTSALNYIGNKDSYRIVIRLKWIYDYWWISTRSMMTSSVVRCSLLLRILKVYRTEIHSGYIQYTYRGFHIPRRDMAPVITIRKHLPRIG